MGQTNTIHTVCLGLGTNIGKRKENLSEAFKMLTDSECSIVSVSSLYESKAWGYVSEHTFYNQCIIIETKFDPLQLLRVIKNIEKLQGRKESSAGYTDRIIDIDILFFDDLILHSEELVIPHTNLADRKFVLYPLAEIAPDLLHPVYNKTIKELKELCKNDLKVYRLSDK